MSCNLLVKGDGDGKGVSGFVATISGGGSDGGIFGGGVE